MAARHEIGSARGAHSLDLFGTGLRFARRRTGRRRGDVWVHDAGSSSCWRGRGFRGPALGRLRFCRRLCWRGLCRSDRGLARRRERGGVSLQAQQDFRAVGLDPRTVRDEIVERTGLPDRTQLITLWFLRGRLRRRLWCGTVGCRCRRRGFSRCGRRRVRGCGRLRGDGIDRRAASRRQLRLIADETHQRRLGAGLDARAVGDEIGPAGGADGGALFLRRLLSRKRGGNANQEQRSEQRRSEHGENPHDIGHRSRATETMHARAGCVQRAISVQWQFAYCAIYSSVAWIAS